MVSQDGLPEPGLDRDEWGSPLNIYLRALTQSIPTQPSDIGAVGQGELVTNVKDHGATGDGVTDDTAAINDALSAGRDLFFPTGTYLVSGLSVTAAGTRLRGASPDLTTLVSSSSDVLTVSGVDASTARLELADLSLNSNTGGGHCVSVPFGVNQSKFTRVQFNQYNTDKSLVYCHRDATNGGLFDNEWDDCYFNMPVNSTVPGFDVVGAGNPASANVWKRSRSQGCGTYMFHLEAGVGNYCYNNTWDTLNFEQADHGGIQVLSGMNTSINNVGFFDNSTIDTDLINLSRAAGCPQSRGTAIRSVHRSNGSLSAGAVDIHFESGQNAGSNLVDAVSSPGSGDVTIDVGSSSGYVVLSGIDSTVTILNFNPDRTVRLDVSSGLLAPLVQLGTVQLRGNPDGLQQSVNAGSTWAPLVRSISLTNYGPVGDGVTDDTAAFSDALSAAASAAAFMPVSVHVPYTTGGYAVTGFTVPSGVTVTGEGRVKITRIGTASATFITMTGVGAGLDSLTIDAANLATTRSVLINGAQKVRLTGNTFLNTGGTGSYMVQTITRTTTPSEDGITSGLVIDDNDFTDCATPIFLNQGPVKTTITNNRFTGWTKRAVYVLGTSTQAVSDLLIAFNTITDPAGVAADTRQPIQIVGDDALAHTRVRIVFNTLIGNAHSYDNPTTPGTADLISAHRCTDFLVVGNTCLDGGDVGITIAQQCARGVVALNVCKSNDSVGICLGSATSDNVTGVAVIGNTCMNNYRNEQSDGIPRASAGILANYAFYSTISGNVCTDDQATKTQVYGVAIANCTGVNYVPGVDAGNITGAVYTEGTNTSCTKVATVAL